MNIACHGKKDYITHDQAVKAIKNMNKNKGLYKVTAYKCTDCGKWHIGQGLGKRKI